MALEHFEKTGSAGASPSRWRRCEAVETAGSRFAARWLGVPAGSCNPLNDRSHRCKFVTGSVRQRRTEILWENLGQQPKGMLMTAALQTNSAASPERVTEADGSILETFAADRCGEPRSVAPRPVRESLAGDHLWTADSGSGVGNASSVRPTRIGTLDGYITIAFGAPHFHLCIGEHHGMSQHPVPEGWPGTAVPRKPICTASWTAKAFPFPGAFACSTARASSKSRSCCPSFSCRAQPKKYSNNRNGRTWNSGTSSRRWLGLTEPDPFDRSAPRFRHG